MKICQALFLALFLVQSVCGDTTPPPRSDGPSDGTRPTPTGTRPTPTGTRPSLTGTKPSLTGTRPSLTGTKPSPTGTRPSLTGTRPEPTGTKPPLTRPPPPERPSNQERCEAAEPQSLAAKYCCDHGLLTGSTDCPNGEIDKRPERCETGGASTRPASRPSDSPSDGTRPPTSDRPTGDRTTGAPTRGADGNSRALGDVVQTREVTGIRKEFKENLDCRPTDQKENEDPRRDNSRISDKVKNLSRQGKDCVKNLKLAVEAVKALVDQWKGDPTRKPRKDTADLEQDTMADTFYDTSDVAVEAEDLSADFDEDNIDKTATDLLPENEGATDKEPKQCQAQYQGYKEELGQVINKFKQLPRMFTEAKIKMVTIVLKDIDLGALDWEDARKVCTFAQGFVTKMKAVRESLSKRLNFIREVLCNKAGALATGGKPGALARCFREARKNNPNDRDENDQVYKRIFGKTNKIFSLIRKKCVAKPKAGGDERKPSARTMRRLKMRIMNACTDQQDVAACRANVMAKIRTAIKGENPAAEVDVTLDDETTTPAARRRLAAGLGANVIITQEGAQANPDYEGAVKSALNKEVEVTSDTTESEETISSPGEVEDVSEVPTIPTDDPQVDAGTVARLAAGAVLAVAFTLV